MGKEESFFFLVVIIVSEVCLWITAVMTDVLCQDLCLLKLISAKLVNKNHKFP